MFLHIEEMSWGKCTHKLDLLLVPATAPSPEPALCVCLTARRSGSHSGPDGGHCPAAALAELPRQGWGWNSMKSSLAASQAKTESPLVWASRELQGVRWEQETWVHNWTVTSGGTVALRMAPREPHVLPQVDRPQTKVTKLWGRSPGMLSGEVHPPRGCSHEQSPCPLTDSRWLSALSVCTPKSLSTWQGQCNTSDLYWLQMQIQYHCRHKVHNSEDLTKHAKPQLRGWESADMRAQPASQRK